MSGDVEDFVTVQCPECKTRSGFVYEMSAHTWEAYEHYVCKSCMAQIELEITKVSKLDAEVLSYEKGEA